MSELQGTDSIQSGLGVVDIFGRVVRSDEVEMCEQVRQCWTGVTGVVNHLDNRIDADYPNSRPLGAPSLTSPDAVGRHMTPYARHLLDPQQPLPDDGFLTEVQREAIAEMARALGYDATTDRRFFAQSLLEWMTESVRYNRDPSLSAEQYLQERRREGERIAVLFSAATPPHFRKDKFDRFAGFMTRMGVAGKLGDTAIDLADDVAKQKIASREVRGSVKKVRFAAAVQASREVAAIMLVRPKITQLIGGKALRFVQNRTGSLNHTRGRA